MTTATAKTSMVSSVRRLPRGMATAPGRATGAVEGPAPSGSPGGVVTALTTIPR